MKKTSKTITTPRGNKAKLAVQFDSDELHVSWGVELSKEEVTCVNSMDVELCVDGTWLPYEETLEHSIGRWLRNPLYLCLKKLGMRDDVEDNYFGIFETQQ